MRAHQASQTAAMVGRIVVYLGADPRRASLLPPGAAELTAALLHEAGLLRDWQRRAVRSPSVRTTLGWLGRRVASGHGTLVALRKRVLDDEVRAALAAGAVQVLVVSPGFDTLAFRLAPAHRHVRFVEIDHPATQSLKRHALHQLDRREGWATNLQLQPADLGATPLPEVLDALGWDRRARSVVIAEDALMGLGEHDVADVLRGVASRLAPGSRLLGTYLVPFAGGGTTARRLARASRRVVDGPRRWATTPEALAALLEDAGFALRDEPGRVDLRLRYLVPAGLDALPLPPDERVLMADRR
jgi:methyltransferase (TIGR00027 family)